MSWRCLDDVMAMVWSLVERRVGVIKCVIVIGNSSNFPIIVLVIDREKK